MEDRCRTYKAGPGCGLFAGFLCLFFLRPTGKFSSARIVWPCLILFVGAFGQVWGQTTKILANNVSSTSGNKPIVWGFNQPTVLNPNNAINQVSPDNQNATVMASPGVILGGGSYSGFIELTFPSTLPANTWSYVRIGANASLLQALLGGSLGELLGDVLGAVLLGNQQIEIQARNSSNVVVESRNSTQGFDTELVKLVQDGVGNFFLAIKPSVSYDRVRLINRAVSLVGLGTQYILDVYNAFYFTGVDPCGPMPTFTSYDGDGISLDLLNLNDLVLNPSHAIDNDPATFSQISLGVLGVAATTEQFIYFNSPVQPGNDILVSLATSASLVDLGLLNNVYLVAYSNGIEVNSVEASTLLELDLLGLLDTDSFLQFPINHESESIDQIGIRVSSLVDAGLLAGGLRIGAVTVAPSPPGFDPEYETGSYIICEGDEQVIEPVNESGRVLNWYHDYDGADFIGQSNEYALQSLAPGDYDFYVRSEYQSCSGEGLPSIFRVTVNPLPQEEDILINSQGVILEENNQIAYPAGSDVVLDPNNSQLPPGTFSWYSNEDEDPLDGVVVDGGTFSVDPITQTLTISTTDALLGGSIFLGYETASGCKEVKEFELLSYIILPIQVHKFEVEANESRQVDLLWELSNEQQQGAVTVQRASANLEFVDLDNLSIVSGEERVRMNFTDFNPLPGRNYYRLLIGKENSNSVFYTEVRMAEVGEFEEPAFIVFPSPFGSSFTVRSTVDLDTPLVASLLNTNGVVIRQVQMGRLSFGEQIEFQDLGSLSAGVYILRVETGRGSKLYRVIKQNRVKS